MKWVNVGGNTKALIVLPPLRPEAVLPGLKTNTAK